MKRLSLIICAFLIILGCDPKQITLEQANQERKAVESQINKFLDSYAAKDLAAIRDLVSSSGEVLIFGTDSAEVNRSVSDFEKQMKNDWQLIASAKHGQSRNLSIQIANSGDFASSVFEVPFDLVFLGQSTHALFRFSFSFIKENNRWLIVQGMVEVLPIVRTENGVK